MYGGRRTRQTAGARTRVCWLECCTVFKAPRASDLKLNVYAPRGSNVTPKGTPTVHRPTHPLPHTHPRPGRMRVRLALGTAVRAGTYHLTQRTTRKTFALRFYNTYTLTSIERRDTIKTKEALRPTRVHTYISSRGAYTIVQRCGIRELSVKPVCACVVCRVAPHWSARGLSCIHASSPHTSQDCAFATPLPYALARGIEDISTPASIRLRQRSLVTSLRRCNHSTHDCSNRPALRPSPSCHQPHAIRVSPSSAARHAIGPAGHS